MITRLFISNFCCFENFEINLKNLPSALLIGANGAGKSTLLRVFKIFRDIGRGEVEIDRLIAREDISFARVERPVKIELELVSGHKTFFYCLELELPPKFDKLRVKLESLKVDGKTVFRRDCAQMRLNKGSRDVEFVLDWHRIGLPLIQETSSSDDIAIFRKKLSRFLILSPIPKLMLGNTATQERNISENGSGIASWLVEMLSYSPAIYSGLSEQLSVVFPDFLMFETPEISLGVKKLLLTFKDGDKTDAKYSLAFDRLSDGEKCLFLAATVITASKAGYIPFCFWDEPENYISAPEVGSVVFALRRAFQQDGQILVASHNPDIVSKFGAGNTIVLRRDSHLMATRPPTLLSELKASGAVNGDTLEIFSNGGFFYGEQI